MGFFCFSCQKKVRGQPINHWCIKKRGKKEAKLLQTRIWASKHTAKKNTAKGNHHKFDTKQTVCNGWKNGFCKFGNKCIFLHGETQPNHRMPCFNWQQNGNCKFGSGCRYFHGAAATPASSTTTKLPSNSLELADFAQEAIARNDESTFPESDSESDTAFDLGGLFLALEPDCLESRVI